MKMISKYHGYNIHITYGQWNTPYPPGLLIDWNAHSDPNSVQSLVNQISLDLSVGTLFSSSKLYSSYYYDSEKPCTRFLDQMQNQLFSELSRETVRSLLSVPYFSLRIVVKKILPLSRYSPYCICYPCTVRSFEIIKITSYRVSAESDCF